MASKTSLSADNLKELGFEKLAALIIDEAKANAPFRKRVSAALAGMKGPEAVAKLVERRLAALEKAQSDIDWHKIKDFEKDLLATLATITGEVGEASPAMAVDLLLRFIATRGQVFHRLEEGGRVENIYEEAAEAIGPLASRLEAGDLKAMPGKLVAALGDDAWYLAGAAEAVMPHLAADALEELDGMLMQRVRSASGDYEANRYRQLRQVLANHQGDFDKWIVLENEKPDHARDRLAVAELLLAAGRAKEALAWAEEDKPSRIGYSDYVDIADGVIQRDPKLRRRAGLKADILEALGQKDTAQALRWTTFEQTLDADLLRVYIHKLDDFAEFDALDRAFAHALDSKSRYRALLFFAQWPRLDQAAKLVLDRHTSWDGDHYQVLSSAADILKNEQPLAATILYRSLIESILTKGRSAAYTHGARYLKILDELAKQLDIGALQAVGRLKPEDWRAALRKTHGRKTGFWAGVS